MSDAFPNTISHVSIGTNDFARSTAFYDRVLKTIGIHRLMEHPEAVAYGKVYPQFWVQTPFDGKTASVGNGTHFAFFVLSKEEVDTFHRKAWRRAPRTTARRGHAQTMASPTTAPSCAIRTDTRSRRPSGIWSSPANWGWDSKTWPRQIST